MFLLLLSMAVVRNTTVGVPAHWCGAFCTHQPKSIPPHPAPCAFLLPHVMLLSQGLTAQRKPFSCPHPALGFWKTRPSPGAPEDAGLGCDEYLGCRALQTLLCGWILCAAAPALLQALSLPGRCEVGQMLLRGAGSCNHGHGSEWIPLSGARERLGGLGSLLQGREEQAQRLI